MILIDPGHLLDCRVDACPACVGRVAAGQGFPVDYSGGKRATRADARTIEPDCSRNHYGVFGSPHRAWLSELPRLFATTEDCLCKVESGTTATGRVPICPVCGAAMEAGGELVSLVEKCGL